MSLQSTYTPLSPETKELLYKRAKRKNMTNIHLYALINNVKESPLHKSYLVSTFCSAHLEEVNGTITTKYCNQRWCNICNSIRSAKLIKWYSPQLENMVEPYFLTLTRPNVEAKDLKQEISYYIKTYQKISKSVNKYFNKIIGIRKLECTYNYKTNTYHPHFHLAVSTKEVAELIQKKWMEYNPTAKSKAQDLRPCYNSYKKDKHGNFKLDENGNKIEQSWTIELFKYFTKLTVKTGYFYKDEKGNQHQQIANIPPRALDVILQAMSGRRVFQTLGTIIKPMDENIKVDESLESGRKDEIRDDWYYNTDILDWISASTGEVLTNYKPKSLLIPLDKFNIEYYKKNNKALKQYLKDNHISNFAKVKVKICIDSKGLIEFIKEKRQKRKPKDLQKYIDYQ